MRGLIAVLALALALAAPSLASTPVATEALSPFAALELAPGVRLLGTPPEFLGPAISNVTIIEQRDGYVVIDTGGTAGHGRVIADYIRSLGPKPVKAIVFTHWHNDHPLGASEIVRRWPRARIIATRATERALLSPALQGVGRAPADKWDVYIQNQVSASLVTIARRRADPSMTDQQRARYDRMARELQDFARAYHGTYFLPPTETFTDMLVLDDPDRPVELRFLGRANTDGDAVAWLPKQRIVATGDIVVSPVPFGFFSYPADWLAVIAKLKAMDFAILIPGHGEPQRDRSYLDKLVATITDVRAQVTPLAQGGASLDEVRKNVDFSAQTAIFGTTPGLARGFDANWLQPMTENAWREAKGLPIVQGGGETTPASARTARTGR